MPKIAYDHEEKTGNIILPVVAPFDGKPVLIRLAAGWVEATWWPGERVETFEGAYDEGFCWDCLDNQFTAELDDALEWAPLPVTAPLCAWDTNPHQDGVCAKCGAGWVGSHRRRPMACKDQ